MNLKRSLTFLAAFVLTVCGDSFAQGSSSFDVDAYKAFLSTHQNLTSEQLVALHQAGSFAATFPTTLDGVAWFDAIDSVYTFTAYEKQLLAANGFVVTELVRPHGYAHGLMTAHNHDLPGREGATLYDETLDAGGVQDCPGWVRLCSGSLFLHTFG